MTERGWYRDAVDPALARWHDGNAFTNHTIVMGEWHGDGQPPPPTAAVEDPRFPAWVGNADEGDSPKIGFPLIVGVVLLACFFVSWFNVGGFIGASGLTIARETVRELRDDSVTVRNLQGLLVLLVPAGGLALILSELLRFRSKALCLSIAAVGPGLLLLWLIESRSVDSVKLLDVGATVGLVVSLALVASALGVLQFDNLRDSPTPTDVVAVTLLAVALFGAIAAPAWQQKSTSDLLASTLKAFADGNGSIGDESSSTFEDSKTTIPPYTLSAYDDGKTCKQHFGVQLSDNVVTYTRDLTNDSDASHDYDITTIVKGSDGVQRTGNDYLSDLAPGETARFETTTYAGFGPGDDFTCSVRVEVL